MKIFTVATVPNHLAKDWLQHLRDFDARHPGCHFEVAADVPGMSVAEMVEAIRISPELTFTQIIERRKKP